MAAAPKNEKLSLSISEAADMLNVSKVTIRRWTDAGKLPCTRVGSRRERRFREADLRTLLPRPRARDANQDEHIDQSGNHRCVLCDDTQHGWDAIVEEINSHLSRGAHVTFIGDATRKTLLANTYESNFGDLKTYTESGQFRQLSVKESYLISGTFSGRRAAAFVESTILDARAKGFEHTLFVGWSDWLSEAQASDFDAVTLDVFEYERELNDIIQRYPFATVLCPYSYSEIPASTLFELATNHPQIQFQTQQTYALNNGSNVR